MLSPSPEIIRLLLKLEAPSDEDVAAVSGLLAAYDMAQTGPGSFHKLVLHVRDDAGQVVGGLVGEIYWDWLFIRYLAVAEAARGQGYGKQLMLAAEDEARVKGAYGIWLDTMSFQARPFYEKLGYRLFAELEHYPNGHSRCFLKKHLSQTMA